MTYGIKIVNNDGVLIIDESHQNFDLYETGTATISGITYIPFDTSTTKVPMFVFQPTASGACNICWYETDGTTYSGVYISNGEDDPAFNINYKVFIETPKVATTSGVVCDVFDEDGVKVFGLDVEGMEVVNTAYINSMYEGANITVTSADNYFFMDTRYYYMTYLHDSLTGEVRIKTLGLKKIDATTVQMKYIIRSLQEFSGGESGYSTGSRNGGSTGGRYLEIK